MSNQVRLGRMVKRSITVLMMLSMGVVALAVDIPGPDGYGYGSLGTESNLRDISGTGTAILTGEDDTAMSGIPIGFTFDYYGQSYTEVTIITNGNVGFNVLEGGMRAEFIPTANGAARDNFIAVCSFDVNLGQDGDTKSIYYQTTGTAPNRQFIVGYYDVKPWVDGEYAGGLYTFELILHETSNQIELQLPNCPEGTTKSIGIENADGTDGLAIINSATTGVVGRAYMISQKGPSNPDPADNSRQVLLTDNVLSWDAPTDVAGPTYDVMFGTEPNALLLTKVSSGQSGTSWTADLDTYGQDYYWQIIVNDPNDGDPTEWEGALWTFQTGGKAIDPVPADGVNNVSAGIDMLSWTGDELADSFDVYIGTNMTDVENSTAGSLAGDTVLLGNVAVEEIAVSGLTESTGYYWRVDEKDADSVIVNGNVWMFRTAGLLAHWTFDTEEADVIDVSGNGNDGVLTNGAVKIIDPDEDERRGKVLFLDQAADPIDHVLFDKTDFPAPWTMTVWVRRLENPAASAALIGSPGSAVKLEQWNGNKQVGITVFGVADYYMGYVTPLDKWDHIAFIADDNGTALYVNGTERNSIPNTIQYPMKTLGCAMRADGNPFDPTRAYIDDVRVYNRVLSEDELLDLISEFNFPPVVNAGPDQYVVIDEQGKATIDLMGSVTDLDETTQEWSKLSGPGNVTFGDASAEETTATFTVEGDYQLILEATDGIFDANDIADITVLEQGYTGLVLHYDFEGEISDPNITNVAGDAALNGDARDGAQKIVDPTRGQVMQLVGESSNVRILEDDDPANDLPLPWTFSAWIKKEQVSDYSTLMWSPATNIKLEQWGLNGRFGFTQPGVADYGFDYVTPLNQWVHLTMVATESGTQLYVNGKLDDFLQNRVTCPLAIIGDPGVTSPMVLIDDLKIFEWPLNSDAVADNVTIPGDLDGDLDVDMDDLKAFAAQWAAAGGTADFNGDGIVDYKDYAILAGNWLVGVE